RAFFASAIDPTNGKHHLGHPRTWPQLAVVRVASRILYV
ncbi:MAG: hypothetical protein ACI90G_002147, partial [Urechidicola sp.]